MSLPRVRPHACIRAHETWQDCARRLAASSYSSRQIADIVGRHHTAVLYVVNAEFRRDKVRAERRRRAQMSAADRREESAARRARAGGDARRDRRATAAAGGGAR